MKSTVVVMGIPESGKSSFIAALSHILQFREIDTALTMEKLADEDRYLYEMRTQWQNCQPFERTKDGIHPITFHLRDNGGKVSSLAFPDIAGEEFEQQWSTRLWSGGYLRAMESAYGALLFVNAKNLVKPISIADVDQVERAVIALVGDGAEGEIAANEHQLEPLDAGEAIVRQLASQTNPVTSETSDPRVWNPRKADQQVKLVDALQSVADFGGDRCWRLGVIISAWDVVRKASQSLTPGAWLEKNMPFLWQYLRSNPATFNFEVFGVSAQGGDPVADADRLQSLDAQSKRVQVESSDYRGHDLTRIVAWVMDRDDS